MRRKELSLPVLLTTHKEQRHSENSQWVAGWGGDWQPSPRVGRLL